MDVPLTGNDAHNRIYHAIIARQAKCAIHRTRNLGRVAQNLHRPHKFSLVRRLNPRLGWRTSGQDDVRLVRFDAPQSGCDGSPLPQRLAS